MSKKNKYCFTIRLNPNSPEQKKAAEILNNIGRYKGPFIAMAVNAYYDNNCTPKKADSDVQEPIDVLATKEQYREEVTNSETELFEEKQNDNDSQNEILAAIKAFGCVEE